MLVKAKLSKEPVIETNPHRITRKSTAAHPTNPLLQRAEVGKAKKSVYSLPPSKHVYGKSSKNEEEVGAAQGSSFLF